MMDSVSQKRFIGVHKDLVKVITTAFETSQVKFKVTEGVRSLARQEQLVKAGASKTMKSRHLTGHAIDIACLVNGDVRWDWPLYRQAAKHIKDTAKALNITIEWGGDWKSFPDGPHFQLPWSKYP